MYEKYFNGKKCFPENVKPVFEERLSWSKYHTLPNQEELTDDKLKKLITFLLPFLDSNHQAIMKTVMIGNMPLAKIGEEKGISTERVRQLLNVSISNMVSGANALFFILPVSEARKKVKEELQSFKNTVLTAGRSPTIIKKDTICFANKGITTYEQLYENIEPLILSAENSAQRSRLELFRSIYEECIHRYDLWEDYDEKD